MDFTPTQLTAITTFDKNLLVSAGAGSGKTSVLVERFIHAVVEHKVSPQRILAITFTEKAANEMKERLIRAFDERHMQRERQELENAYISTIHSFCARLLKENPIEAAVDPHFCILDEASCFLVTERILDELFERLSREADFFDLFRAYGPEYDEDVLRRALRSFHDAIQRTGKTLDSILEKVQSLSPKPFYDQMMTSLNALLALRGGGKETTAKTKRFDAAEEIRDCLCAHSADEWDWTSLAVLAQRMKALDLRDASLRQPIEALRQAFDSFYAVWIERLGERYKRVFMQFYQEFVKSYDEYKQERAVLDFSDLLVKTYRLLAREDPVAMAVRRRYQNHFAHILVDEFQDTNLLQARIVDLLSSGNNLFIVGDKKQSIYAFQGAEVKVFEEKEQTFSQTPRSLRLSLNDNFRSRPEILGFINRLFEMIWKEDGFPYEKLLAHRLASEKRESVDILLTAKEKEEPIDEARVREARRLAAHLQKLVEQGLEIEVNGQIRPVDYSDCAILFRAMTRVGLYETELRRRAVPYYVVKGRGFYDRQEIRDLMDILSLVENPLEDIPLAAVLRSPLVGVSEDTLFWLSRFAKGDNQSRRPLYEGFYQLPFRSEITPEEREKLECFETLRKRLEKEKHHLRLTQILKRILAETLYDIKILGTEDGKRKYANIQKLIEVAREFEMSEAFGLADFIRYIQNLSLQEAKESEAAIELERGNVVRLMTIHQAKGLEFPVVVIADLGGERKPPTRPSFTLSEEKGIGCKVRHPITREWEKGFVQRQHELEEQREEEGELKRLFYVALTRAKEHLVLSGVLPDQNSKPDQPFSKLGTWSQWLVKALGVEASEMSDETDNQSVREESLVRHPMVEKVLQSGQPIVLDRWKNATEEVIREVEGRAQAIVQQIEPIVPARSALRDLPVTALMRFKKCPLSYFYRYEMGFPDDAVLYEEEGLEETVVAEEENVFTPVEFGTLFHRVMEHFDFKADEKQELARVENRLAKSVPLEVRKKLQQSVERFLTSSFGGELKTAQPCFRELEFLVKAEAGKVRGKIDLLYQNPKREWIVLDYKTSAVRPQELESASQDYLLQMELYALACRDIAKLSVKKGVLFFTEVGKAFEVPIEGEVLDQRRKWLEDVLETLTAASPIEAASKPVWKAHVSDFCKVCGFRSFCPKEDLRT